MKLKHRKLTHQLSVKNGITTNARFSVTRSGSQTYTTILPLSVIAYPEIARQHKR